MNILITGVRGVIGNLLRDKLIERGHIVIGVDLLHGNGERGFSQEMSYSDDIPSYIRCDVANYRQLERIFYHYAIDMVYNCAAECGRWSGEDFYEQLWNTNMVGLKNLLMLQLKYHFKLVHFSTSEIYGNTEEIMVESLADKINPDLMNDYAISKWANEKQIKNAIRLYDNQVVIVRPFNTYGIGEYYHPYRSVNVKLCYHAINDMPITIYRGHYRTNIYLDDFIITLSNIVDNFISGRVYNIGGEKLYSIEDMAHIVWNYAGTDKRLLSFADSEKTTVKTKAVNCNLAKSELGHHIYTELDVGFAKTIDWLRSL